MLRQDCPLPIDLNAAQGGLGHLAGPAGCSHAVGRCLYVLFRGSSLGEGGCPFQLTVQPYYSSGIRDVQVDKSVVPPYLERRIRPL